LVVVTARLKAAPFQSISNYGAKLWDTTLAPLEKILAPEDTGT
jgi:hypothetical protein